MYIKFTKGVLMRVNITSVIVLVAIMQVSAATLAQPYITIKKRSATLKEIFLAIKEQTDYSVFYSAKKLDDLRQVNANFVHAGLTDVLEKCVEGQPFTFTIEKQTILIKEKEKGMVDKVKDFFIVGGRATDEERGVPSQDGKTITGRVTDSLGTPLENATVRIKGTNRATFTDKNGEFTLRGVVSDGVLQISYVGFTTREVAVSGWSGTLVLYRSAATLEEAQVFAYTGYEKISKERVTGSYDIIDQKLIDRKISTNIIDRIENLTPGVYFDKKYSSGFTVRGISSLTSTISSPLIIIDNFPYDGDIQNINYNDIQSITILKDGAATSIWGARAGNGVIVITTKKGQYQAKNQLSFSSSINLTEKPDLFAAKTFSTSDFIDVEQFLFSNGFFNGAINNNRRYPIVSPVVEILQMQKDGLISEDAATASLDSLRHNDVRHDYLKYLYRTSVNQQYALNFSGGDQQVNYYLSGGYDKNLNNLVGNQYDRFTVRNQTSYKPVKSFELNIGIQYTNTKTKANSIGGTAQQLRNYSTSNLYPYARLKNADGTNANFSKDYRKSFTDTAGNGALFNWTYNPLDELNNNNNSSNSSEWLTNIGLNYKITSWFNVEARYQYESASTLSKNIYNSSSYFTRNMINQYTQINSDGSLTYPIPLGSILDQSTGLLSSHSFRTQANLTKKFGKDNLTAIAGFEIKQAKSDYSANRLYGYDYNTLVYAQNLDFVSYFQSYDNLNFSNPIPNPSTLSQLINRFVSYYSNASYSINSKYVLSGSIRRDESNLFGVKTNQKGVPLYSAGGSWTLSNERFYHSNLFPFLKVRYTFGRSGNVNNGLSALPTIKFLNGSIQRFTNLPFANINSYANPNLRWERVSMHNIGLDFAIKNQNISGYVEYYIKNSKDLLSAAPADVTNAGQESLTTNNAALRGRGLDINLNVKVINREFNWHTTLNLSYNKTIVSKYLLIPTFPAGYVGGGYISPNVGSNIYNIVAYKWAGLDSSNGDPRGYFQGKISKDYSSIINSGTWPDLVTVGPTIPQYFGSVRNNFAYKTFALSINITYKFDYFLRKTSVNYTSMFNGGVGHSDYSLRWQQPGDELKTNVPSMVYPADNYRDDFYANSEVNVIKGDNIRIADCNFSFQLNNRWAKSISLTGLQIYSYVNNIGIIWKANKFGIDPDTQNGVRNPRSFGLGLRASL